MKIIIVTTENNEMKETGFGIMKSCIAVKEALMSPLNDVSIITCASEKDLEGIVALKPDIVFLGVKYIDILNGEQIWLSAYFEDAGVVFTGSERRALEFDSNKISAKNQIRAKGIMTAEYMTIRPDNYLMVSKKTMTYPQFLKPLNAANGNGIDNESIVFDDKAFVAKSEKLFAKYGDTVISETYLGGREFTVGIIYDPVNNQYITAQIEIVPPVNQDNFRILGEQVKSEDSEELKIVINQLIRKQLKKMAIDCFIALGARDFGRIDIKMDEEGVCYFLEANLVPGMTKGSSYFPKSFEIDKQLSYANVVDLILANATERIVETELESV